MWMTYGSSMPFNSAISSKLYPYRLAIAASVSPLCTVTRKYRAGASVCTGTAVGVGNCSNGPSGNSRSITIGSGVTGITAGACRVGTAVSAAASVGCNTSGISGGRRRLRSASNMKTALATRSAATARPAYVPAAGRSKESPGGWEPDPAPVCEYCSATAGQGIKR